MKLKKIACGVVAIGAAAGFAGVQADAASATSITLAPYLLNVVGVGSTGGAGSTLCLARAVNGGGPMATLGTPFYNGKVNGTVVNAATVIEMVFTKQDFVTSLPTCTLTQISADDVGTTAAFNTTKHTAKITLVQTTATQSGITATAQTFIRVNYTTGQTVVAPVGSTVVAGALSGGTSVDLQLANQLTKTKSILDLTACLDTDTVIDLTGALDAKGNHTSAALGATNNLANSATLNYATFHECAQTSAPPAPGKPVKTTIAISGAAGPASVQFLKAGTANPQTWDTTRGACKLTDQVNRVLTCKGDYGDPIPLTIDVREVDGANTGIDPLSLQHIAAPHTFPGTVGTL